MEPKPNIRFIRIIAKGDNWSMVEILPRDSHISFYGKAHALLTPFYIALFSYHTPILVYHPDDTSDALSEYTRLYDGGYELTRHMWGMDIPEYMDNVSPTTLRHIKAFCGMNKKEFLAHPFNYGTVTDFLERMDKDTDGYISRWSAYPVYK